MRYFIILLMTILIGCHDVPCQECHKGIDTPFVKQDTFYLGDTSNMVFSKDLKMVWQNGESRVIFNPIYISTYQDTYFVKYQFGTLRYDGERISLQIDSTLNPR